MDLCHFVSLRSRLRCGLVLAAFAARRENKHTSERRLLPSHGLLACWLGCPLYLLCVHEEGFGSFGQAFLLPTSPRAQHSQAPSILALMRRALITDKLKLVSVSGDLTLINTSLNFRGVRFGLPLPCGRNYPVIHG